VLLSAQEPTAPEIHGFGGWAYGRTNGNTFDVGNDIGNYHPLTMAVALAAAPVERLHIAVQAAAVRERGDETSIEIDYALAQWQVSDALRLRFGRIKQPFGLSTEVFHVGILRPFVSLPLSIYGPAGIVTESIQGISIVGLRPLKSSWELDYTVYLGHADLPDAPPLVPLNDSLVHDVTDVVGGRLNLLSSTGVLFGLSAYTGHGPRDMHDRHVVVGSHVEYNPGVFLLRIEGVAQNAPDEHARAGYLEAAYHLTPQWQMAVRGDASNTKFADPDLGAIPNGGQYREGAIGLNYWFVPEFVLKLSLHQATGRRFALPKPNPDETIPPGMLPKNNTTLGVFGAQFSF